MLDALDHQVQQFERGGVDPVHILIQRQHRLVFRQARQLVQQGLKGFFLLLPGRQIQGWIARSRWDPEQINKKRGDRAHIPHRKRQQGLKLIELLLGRFLPGQTGRPLEERDDGVKGRVAVIG